MPHRRSTPSCGPLRTALFGALIGVFGALVILCLIWPLAAALAACATPEAWRDAGLNARRLGLFWRGVWVSAAAAAIAQPIGAALAVGLVGPGARGRRLALWTCLTVLLIPPYVYAYAWSLPLLPEGIVTADALLSRWSGWLATTGRAIGCLGTWGAPLAAVVLALGWRASGAAAYELARLDAGGARAIWSAVVPAVWPWLVVAYAAVWAVAINEYSVCHLCLVQTWNTEVLAEIQLLGASGRGFALGWPLMVLVALALWIVWARRGPLLDALRDLAHADATESAAPGPRGEAARTQPGVRSAARAAPLAAAGLLALPILLLAFHLRDPAALATAWRVWSAAWLGGALAALGAALASVGLAIGADALNHAARRGGRAGRAAHALSAATVACAAVAAAAPPALVGDAFAAAYARVPVVADHWPIVSLVSAARFAIIPILALRLAGDLLHPQIEDLAATDGAAGADAYSRVRLPLCRSALVCGGGAVALLALTEVAATSLVKPAGVNSLATTLLNEIHYGRSDQVVALTLYLIALVAVAVGAGMWPRRIDERRRSARRPP